MFWENKKTGEERTLLAQCFSRPGVTPLSGIEEQLVLFDRIVRGTFQANDGDVRIGCRDFVASHQLLH